MAIIDVPDDIHPIQQAIMGALIIIDIAVGIGGIVYIIGVTYWGW